MGRCGCEGIDNSFSSNSIRSRSVLGAILNGESPLVFIFFFLMNLDSTFLITVRDSYYLIALDGVCSARSIHCVKDE